MEKTFTLGNNNSMEELGGTYREIPNLINEVEIHNWIIELFSNNDINKIVIEIGKNPLLSLQIGYHIRLSIENIKDNVLAPILYVSNLRINSIMLKTGVYSQILATKGVFFSEFNLQSNKEEIKHLNGLNESEYLTKFLKIIHIQADETVGRHSLANIWGAYALDKAANTNALSDDSEFKKKLYFKYVSAFNSIDKLKPSQQNVVMDNRTTLSTNLKVLKSMNKPKRVLLIDDEASNGWETVLRKIFKTIAAKDFVVINEKVKDFESLSEINKNLIVTEGFDLYLVDLRLNGLDEDENIKTEDFSGMKILKKIKSLNQGNQVVVFSASNKVWNLKALLEAGADGYYMKESPEYNFSKKVSEQKYKDFKSNVDKCFERSYLRELYEEIKVTKESETNQSRDFLKESETIMIAAWELIKNENVDLAYLILFQIIESYADKSLKFNQDLDSYELFGNTVIENLFGEGKRKWILKFNKGFQGRDYFSIAEYTQESSIKPSALFKASCLLYQNYNKTNADLKEFGRLNKIRNNIAHGGVRNFATKDDVIEVLKIIKDIRNN